MAQSANRQEARRPSRKSDIPIRARTWGNAHRAKGDTYGSPFDGNVNHTQRWARDDYGSRTDSQPGSKGTADALYVAADVTKFVWRLYDFHNRTSYPQLDV